MNLFRRRARAATACCVIALAVAAFAAPTGPSAALASTGSSYGTISGSGTIQTGTETIAVTVSASYDGSPPTGTFSIATYPTVTPAPSLPDASFGPGPTQPSVDASDSGPLPIQCLWITGSKAVIGGTWEGAPILVWISDGAPADTLELYRGAPDCTIGPVGFGGTFIASGDFTVMDSDFAPADGIQDTLQPTGTPAGSFIDTNLPTSTFGSIVAANGLTVRVTDAPAPTGVAIDVGSGAQGLQAQLSLCSFTVMLDAGTTATATCGSLSLSVAAGLASVILSGGTSVVSVPAGGAGKVTELPGGTIQVQNIGTAGSPHVSISIAGSTTLVPAGTTTSVGFVGFSPPVDNAPVVNRAKAGQALPIKWRLMNAAGEPISNITSATISVTSYDCSLATTIDDVEVVVAGGSGLLNLGSGYYQMNWKSPTTYAGLCKVMHLTVAGVAHDALFQFVR